MTIRQRPSHRDGERSTYQLIKALENFFPTGVIRNPYLSGMIYPRSINNLTVVRLTAVKDKPMIARASLVYGKPGGKSTFKTWPEGFIKPSRISCHFFSRRESPGNCCVFFIYFNVLHLTRPRQVEYKPKIQDYARPRGYASTKVIPIPRFLKYHHYSNTKLETSTTPPCTTWGAGWGVFLVLWFYPKSKGTFRLLDSRQARYCKA